MPGKLILQNIIELKVPSGIVLRKQPRVFIFLQIGHHRSRMRIENQLCNMKPSARFIIKQGSRRLPQRLVLIQHKIIKGPGKALIVHLRLQIKSSAYTFQKPDHSCIHRPGREHDGGDLSAGNCKLQIPQASIHIQGKKCRRIILRILKDHGRSIQCHRQEPWKKNMILLRRMRNRLFSEKPLILTDRLAQRHRDIELIAPRHSRPGNRLLKKSPFLPAAV